MSRISARSWLALSAVCLAAGCNEDSYEEPGPPAPQPGTIEYTTALLVQANAALQGMVSCLDENALMRSMQILQAGHKAVSFSGAPVDGRTFVLDPAALPTLTYVEDPSAPLPPSRFRFVLYRAETSGEQFGGAT